MRSKSITLRLPVTLLEAGAELAHEDYDNFNELMVGLLRYALAIHKPHMVTAQIAKLSLAEQDVVDDEIVKMFRSGAANKGSWFEHLTAEAATRVAKGKNIPASAVGKEIVSMLRAKPSKSK